MVKARKYVVKKNFDGLPKHDDFEIVEYDLPPLKDGEFIVKGEWISVDPYIHASNKLKKVPYDVPSFHVGTVQESRNSEYPVGVKVVSHKGWCDYGIVDPSEPTDPGRKIYKLPDMKGLSASIAVGAAGMPGVTAYFGLLEICKPNPGETVVVTGAAGAVGSLVGQIAKIKGCKVIGFTGSDDKVRWLEQELGFDKAFNYKTVNAAEALKQAAPNGVDCYFDNVGGEISSEIMSQMNDYGRVGVCGCMSLFNESAFLRPSSGGPPMPKASVLQPIIIIKQLKIEGLRVGRWDDRWGEATAQMIDWIKSGKLKAPEHVTEGFENIPDAFRGMLEGKNYGKAVIKI